MVAAVAVVGVMQIIWRIVLAFVDEAHGKAVEPLTFGLHVAMFVVIALAGFPLARRLSGARRAGMWIVVGAAGAAVVALAVYEAVLYRRIDAPMGTAYARLMVWYGWGAIDVIVVGGFALAAGRRGAWLALPGIGLALLQARPFMYVTAAKQVALVVYAIGSAVVMVLMADQAERGAREVAAEVRERAIGGARRGELWAWCYAALAVTWLAPAEMTRTPAFAVALAATAIAVDVVGMSAVWRLASARTAGMPRWPWIAVMAMLVWKIARTSLVWCLTLTRWWGHLDDAPLQSAPWWAAVPTTLVWLGQIALAVYARRIGSRPLWTAALAASAVSVVASVIHFALPDQRALVGTAYIVTNLVAVYAYRTAVRALDGGLPRARVI